MTREVMLAAETWRALRVKFCQGGLVKALISGGAGFICRRFGQLLPGPGQQDGTSTSPSSFRSGANQYWASKQEH